MMNKSAMGATAMQKWYHADEIENAERYQRRGLAHEAVFLAAELQAAYQKGKSHGDAAMRTSLLELLDDDRNKQQAAFDKGRRILQLARDIEQEQNDFDCGPSLPTEPYTVPDFRDSPTWAAVQDFAIEHGEPIFVATINSHLLGLAELAGETVQIADEPNSNERVDSGPFMEYQEHLRDIRRALLGLLGLA